jgi:hypothetical protein
VIEAGRFVLVHDLADDEVYATSWDTWEQAEVAFEDGRMPAGFTLIDTETGRRWLPGSRYEWEDAQT